MGNRHDIARLRRGVRGWNEWRKQRPGRKAFPRALADDIRHGPDLSHADLRNLDLTDAYLVGADLQSADLRGTRFRGASLRGARLDMADLRGANMVLADLSQVKADWANFNGANLRAADLRNSVFRESKFVRTNLRHTDIRAAQFLRADLTRADLTNALLLETIFGDATLRITRGLENCYHEGPSIIDYHTLVKSGTLPVEFLRECGLSNRLVAQLPQMLEARASLRCFISYAVEDERLVERLNADLQSRDIRCWYFREHARVGRLLEQDIAERIAKYDKVILVCSRHALTSQQVLKEVEQAAQKEEQSGASVLVPITVDDYVFGDWRHRRRRNVVDKMIGHFQEWNRRGRYDVAFKKLYDALNDGDDVNDEGGE
jgi:TIR domain/Pentapeptide repeats (9 copies)/Pentapeptide repeats (8 copies)